MTRGLFVKDVIISSCRETRMANKCYVNVCLTSWHTGDWSFIVTQIHVIPLIIQVLETFETEKILSRDCPRTCFTQYTTTNWYTTIQWWSKLKQVVFRLTVLSMPWKLKQSLWFVSWLLVSQAFNYNNFRSISIV